MPINFKADALEFVRQNNCAIHTPVDLIERAMIYGALTATEPLLKQLRDANKDLAKKRADSQPHKEQTKMIPLP